MQLLKKINKNRWVWTQDCWFVTLGYPNNNKKYFFTLSLTSHDTRRGKAALENKAASQRGIFFWRGCPWWQTFDVFWLDSGGGDYQRLREINVLLIKRTWVGGRQTVLFMTGPVSALSRASQIPKTGKYFNCKHPWLDSLRGPPVRLFFFFHLLLLTHLLSCMTKNVFAWIQTTHADTHLHTLPSYNSCYNYPTKLRARTFPGSEWRRIC